MKIHQVTLMLVLGFSALPCSAQSMRPGWWEIKTQVNSPGGEMERAMAQMQKELARMSPEQRQMVEQSMARQGVGLAPDGQPMSARICVSKDMAQRRQVPIQRQGNCTEKHGAVSKGKMKSSFTCTQPPATGEAETTFDGDAAYTMTMRTSTTVSGKQQHMTLRSSGRWVSADCGAIQPVAPR